MPFYKFNAFTGRLTELSHLQPLYPISVQRLNTIKFSKMIWDTLKTKPVKSIATSAASCAKDNCKLLKRIETIEANRDKPMYLATNWSKILYYISLLGVMGGILTNCYLLMN